MYICATNVNLTAITMNFRFRDKELDILRNMRWLSEQQHSRFTLLYGEPGSGKTRLVSEALKGFPCLWVCPGEITEALLLESLSAQAVEVMGAPLPDNIKDMEDFLNFMFNTGHEISFSVIIKEFQDLDPGTFALLRRLWGVNRLSTHINLVLVSSDLSYIRKLDANPNLAFNNLDSRILLVPFSLAEQRSVLESMPGFKEGSEEERADAVLAMFGVSGGMPSIVAEIHDSGIWKASGILAVALSGHSSARRLWSGVISNVLGKNSESYCSVLQVISRGSRSQADIEAHVGSGNLGGHLARLEQDYCLLGRSRPVFSDGKSRGVVRYGFLNPSLEFWFAQGFALDHRGFSPERAIAAAREGWQSYSVRVMRRFFAKRLQEENGYTNVGSWWEPATRNQVRKGIDLVAWRDTDKKILVADVCRDEESFDSEGFVKRVNRLSASTGHRKVDARLFTLKDI